VLASVREAKDREQREVIAAQSAVQSAETSYRRASDYVLGRRDGVGSQARTRLTEAERHLAQARQLVSSNRATAQSEAAQAGQLADEAYTLARQDFDRYNQSASMPTGIPGGLGNILFPGGGLGGIMRGGGFGGTPWGIPFPTGGGRRGWGGGGGSRGGGGGGRSSGGSSGGGGGRSRGGRW
jgi:hypothetical protein